MLRVSAHSDRHVEQLKRGVMCFLYGRTIRSCAACESLELRDESDGYRYKKLAVSPSRERDLPCLAGNGQIFGSRCTKIDECPSRGRLLQARTLERARTLNGLASNSRVGQARADKLWRALEVDRAGLGNRPVDLAGFFCMYDRQFSK